MVQRFQDDDTGYLAWLATNPAGYVLNCTPTPSTSYLLLHQATCFTISRQPTGGSSWTHEYIKVCASTYSELDEWALLETGSSPTRLLPLRVIDLSRHQRKRRLAFRRSSRSPVGASVAGSGLRRYLVRMVPRQALRESDANVQRSKRIGVFGSVALPRQTGFWVAGGDWNAEAGHQGAGGGEKRRPGRSKRPGEEWRQVSYP